MSETETKARAGTTVPEAASPAEEVKTALAGLLTDLGDFQDEMTTKFQQQEELTTLQFSQTSQSLGILA